MKNNKKRPWFMMLFSVAIIILLGWGVISAFRFTSRTEMVYRGTLEDRIYVDGYILRDEMILDAPINGYLACNVMENERVKIGMKVATIFVKEEDAVLQARLTRVNERIRDYQKASDANYYADTLYKTEYQTTARVREIIGARYARNIIKISQYKDEIYRLLEQKSGGEDRQEDRDNLAALQQEKAELESKISGVKNDIYASIPGVFSSQVDGYEKIFDVVNRRKLTPRSIESVDNMTITPVTGAGNPIAKIINNYTWYFASVVDKQWVEGLDLEDTLSIRIPDLDNKEVRVWVDAINTEQEGDLAVIVLGCDNAMEPLFALRKVSVEIIKDTFTGLKVQNSAICAGEDGSDGVYILRDKEEIFRKVEILYRGESYSVVKENFAAGELAMYDEVVVNRK